MLILKISNFILVLDVGCKKKDDGIEVFQLDGLQSLLNQSGFEKCASCFHYRNYVLKKQTTKVIIFSSNNNFEKVTNIFGEITHWQYKSMRLQRNFFCGHIGLLWNPVANKLGGI